MPLAPSPLAYDLVSGALASKRCVLVGEETGFGHAVRAGCDVVTTGTPHSARTTSPLWLERTRRGVRLARQAIADEKPDAEVVVALRLGDEIAGPHGAQSVARLGRALDADAPDLLIVEGLSVVRPSLYAAVGSLLETGLPVWLSFRRCVHGLCGEYGQHWGGPERDEFGRAAQRLEELGVAALIAGGIPPDHVEGMITHLREFTSLPLGVSPNVGYATEKGWRSDAGVAPADYARLATRWRDEGAQLIGGGGGVQAEHLDAARDALDSSAPRNLRPVSRPAPPRPAPDTRWRDAEDRSLYPLPVPEIVAADDVFVPTQGSYLVWRHLFRERTGRAARCLDVGCGSGLQTIQLARNGAAHVHGIDIDPGAVEATLANAHRNSVADRVSAAVVDLYAWAPEERYDAIVASLYQTPVDPHDAIATHRPADFWGRNAVDHLIGLLPQLLTDTGVAYVMQLSILSQQRTDELLAQHDLQARVADFAFFPFTENFRQSAAQIAAVEQLSDAHHLSVAGDDVMVAYLLEVTRSG